MRRPRPRLWWGLAAMTVMLVLFGLTDILAGLRADPGITVALTGLTPDELEARSPEGFRLADYMARSAGLVLLGFGVVMTAIVAIPYRRREHWAWLVAWTLPVWAALVPVGYLAIGLAPNVPPPPPMISGPIIAVLAAAILLIDRGAFAARVGRTDRLAGERLTASSVEA
jgi:hypothetical protein